MLYSIEYEKDLTEGKDPEGEKKKTFGFDKFMDDILIREGKSHEGDGDEDEAHVEAKKKVLVEAQEHERLRRRWRERYAESPYSRMHVKK